MASSVEPSSEDQGWIPAAWVPEQSFGGRLVLVRREKGLTQRQAAEACGFSDTTWNNWEHGTMPQAMNEVVEAIHQGLGVRRTWLMWGTAQVHSLTLVPIPDGQQMFNYDPPPDLGTVACLPA